LVAKLGKNVGTAIGLELREPSLVLGPKSRGAVQKIRSGQCYNVQIALAGLTNEKAKEGSKGRAYAVLVADTAVVRVDGAAPEVLTSGATKALKDIAYQINDDEEDEDDAKEKKAKARAAKVAAGGVVLDAKTRGEEGGPTDEDARRRKQATLADKKNRETHARLIGAQNAELGGGKSGATADFVAYERVADVPVPRSVNPVLTVDRDAESVLLPIHGQLVPFHIAAVKSVSVTQDAGASFIRINFNAPTAPGATAANATYPANVKFPDLSFLREVSYRSSDNKHANYVVQEMRALKRAVTQRETEKAERATLVRQERLVLSHGRVHRLVGLWMQPTFGGRGGRKAGTLEAHTNGLRYVGAKAEERVDVMYGNVKHAFFQPAKKEIKTLIHFHLHDAIMIGKKKTKDVQFYMEIMEAVQSLDGGRRNMYDPDEIEEEQRDREREKRIHKEFSGFCRKVQDIWEKDFPDLGLEFDSPYHDLAFDGVPFKSTVRILPTATCLVELTEFPPLVINAEDIEVVNLERVGFHLKNFDMAVIFKDFSRDVHRIDQIPVQNLDNIKQWLATLDIKYYEGKSNLNWKPLLKQIKEDPDEWLESGGWEFLNNEIDDDDEEDGEGAESESDFEPSDSDEDESEEESESESMVESEEDESEEEELSDSGMDWDELEEEAAAADEEASESDRGKKRKKGKR
jgi:nucleosome binding factor SPN SPT16 subunit